MVMAGCGAEGPMGSELARSRRPSAHREKLPGKRARGEMSESGGGSGIRTHGDITASPVFKTGALNRSAIPPTLISLAFFASLIASWAIAAILLTSAIYE